MNWIRISPDKKIMEHLWWEYFNTSIRLELRKYRLVLLFPALAIVADIMFYGFDDHRAWIISVIFTICTLLSVVWFMITYLLNYRKFRKWLKQRLSELRTFDFGFDQNKLYFKAEGKETTVNWTDIAYHYIKNQTIYLYNPSKKFINMFSPKLLPDAEYKRFGEMVMKQTLPLIRKKK